MNKKAMSDVVTTVIIVALSIVAIAVVWIVIQNLITSNTESISSSADFLKLNFKFESAKNNSGNLFVIVKRNAGDGNFNAIKFAVIYKNSSSESFVENGSLGILETKGYSLPISGELGELSKIEGYPAVISDSGKSTTSSIHFDYSLEGLAFSTVTTQSQSSLNDGLVLYLPFNSGEELLDKSGNGNDATNYGATWTSNGKIGGAYGFYKNSSKLRIPYNSKLSFNYNNNFSVFFWFFPLTNTGKSPFLISRGEAKINLSHYNYKIAYYALSNISVIISNSSGQQIVVSNYSIKNNDWNFIGLVYNSANHTLTGYGKDGNSFGSLVLSGVSTDLNDLFIGGLSSPNSGNFREEYYSFNGSIDEVRIYNRALFKEEIQELYSLS